MKSFKALLETFAKENAQRAKKLKEEKIEKDKKTAERDGALRWAYEDIDTLIAAMPTLTQEQKTECWWLFVKKHREVLSYLGSDPRGKNTLLFEVHFNPKLVEKLKKDKESLAGYRPRAAPNFCFYCNYKTRADDFISRGTDKETRSEFLLKHTGTLDCEGLCTEGPNDGYGSSKSYCGGKAIRIDRDW